MKVLVTGGAGYIGSILVPRLLAAGYQVTVLDAIIYAQAALLECCANSGFTMVRGDCRDRAVMQRLVGGVDAIIPLAAIVGAPACAHDPTAAWSINRDAVIMLEELRHPDQMLILPVTNSGYGIGQSEGLCTEESPLRPLSIYGRSKVEAEAAVLSSGTAMTYRLATVFGAAPRMRTDLLVNDFVYRAVADSAVVLFEAHFRRNFIHIRDVAEVFVHGLENYHSMKGRTYNVGLSNANLSKWQLCERIKKHVPGFAFVESQINSDPDKRDYIVSNERIESTGWIPRHTLDDGILELIKAYSIVRDRRYCNA